MDVIHERRAVSRNGIYNMVVMQRNTCSTEAFPCHRRWRRLCSTNLSPRLPRISTYRAISPTKVRAFGDQGHAYTTAALDDVSRILQAAKAAGGVRNPADPSDLLELPPVLLDPAFWSMRAALVDALREERDPLQKRRRLLQLEEEEAAVLGPLTPRQHHAYTQLLTQLRVAAGEAQKARVVAALQGGLRVVVDCGFQGGRSSKELRSLAKQLEVAVTFNRRCTAPVALTLCQLDGEVARIVGGVGADAWPVNMHAAPAVELLAGQEDSV